jgi:hypothetical protein
MQEAIVARIKINDLPKDMKLSDKEIREAKGGALLLPLAPSLPYYDYIEIKSKIMPVSGR